MKSTKVFLDTNVLLDYVLDRGEFSILAEQIFERCVRGEIECYVAAHSIVNMFYVLRKLYSVRDRKQILSSLCTLCYVQAVDGIMVQKALDAGRDDNESQLRADTEDQLKADKENQRQADIEDQLQILCAGEAGADCIITRDARGFKNSPIKVMTPKEFLFS